MLSPRLRYLLKLLVSITIIFIILSQIDWQTLSKTLQRADYALLCLAFLLLWVERVWAVFKWRFLLVAHDISISLWKLFTIYNIGAFWGMFLPSSLSTDVVRGYYLTKNIDNMDLSAASVVVDRMMGLFSLLFLCLLSILFYSSTFDTSLIHYVLILTLCGVGFGIAVHLDIVSDFLERRVKFFTHNALGAKLLGMHRVFLSFKKLPSLMVTSFFYSVILQLIRIITMYVTARAFQIDLELIKFFIVVPITVIVIMIPVSIGGLGVREGSFVSLFGLVGLNINESFAISATNSIMVTVIGLVGGIFYLFHSQKVPSNSIKKIH